MRHRNHRRLIGARRRWTPAAWCLYLAAVGLCAVPADAQTRDEEAAALRNDVEAIAEQMVAARNRDRNDVDGTLTINRYGNLLGAALMRAHDLQVHGGLSDLMAAAEEGRTDEQIGGGSGARGTTTLVSKGSVPAILGFAVENGALTQSTSGTTITFTGNPVGIARALQNKGFVATAGVPHSGLETLSHVSFAVSFDASRGVSTPTFTGDRQQLSQYRVRAELVNHRDPRRSALWQNIPALTPLAAQQATWILTVQTSRTFQDWFAPLQTRVAELSDASFIRDAILEAVSRFPFAMLDADTAAALGDFGAAVRTFEQQRTAFLDRVRHGLLITFEYVNNRQLDDTSTSTLNFIAEKGTGGMDFTFNASSDLVNGTLTPSAPDRMRDVQLSAQIDVPLLRRTDTGLFLFSLAGKYQYVKRDPALGPLALAAPSASLAVAQMKFTIPMGASGTKIPLSISFANRTELINEHEVRGNIGVTYDLDALFARRP
jgi:hypothetical protein